jgi:hypothetical protein
MAHGKPDIAIALGIPTRHAEEDEEDGKPSEEEIHESKLAAANEMLSAFHSMNAEKLVEAMDTFCDLYEPDEEDGEEEEDEDEHDEDAEPEEEEDGSMRRGEEP